MANVISLIIFKDGCGYDISRLIEKVTWEGRKGASARSLTVRIIDDDGYKHARSGIDVEQGHQCVFCYNGKELFRGMIMSQTQTNEKTLTFTAYDNGIYLANNKDTFVYENKTASDIFHDCCTRFGIPMGEVAKCTYNIPELIKSKTTAFDAIADALSLDFDATGIRHYVSSDKGKLSLLTRRENILQWVIEVKKNIISYSYAKSIEDLKTRVVLVSKEGTTIAEKYKPELEKKLGTFQEIDTPDESLTDAQINDLIDSILDEKSTPSRSMSIEALGKTEVISGMGVFVIIPALNLSRTFYVDSDSHTFANGKHTMSLKLTYANDLTKETKNTNTSKAEHKIGDIVNFHGGHHYVSSVESTPTGSQVPPGPAKLTLIAAGAKHPYHLIHTDNSTWVYGWVDEGTFD